MSTDYVKRYYNKINTRVTQVNEKDPFSTSFLSAIGTGDNTLFQKYLIETRIFDGSWLDFIAQSIPYIDNIIRNPKSFIKSESEIVPVELAKKTSAASVRHLAANTRFIREITNKGDVIPEKVLTVFHEEDLAIYENRFVKTLIDKLVLFVEKRYTTITRLIGSDFINKFDSGSVFEYDDMKIDFGMHLNIEKKVTDSEAEIKNQEILDKMTGIRASILGFASSAFMRDMKSARPVRPPIQKTNILTKDPNYRRCYEVWLFLDACDKVDYTVETGISDQKINEEYVQKVRELILLSFATVVGNDESELGRFATLPKVSKRQKKTKILSDPSLASREKSMVMESNLINEFYYQEARKLYSRRIEAATIDGDPYHVALKDAYQKAFEITENIFQSLMEIPEEVKSDPIALYRYRMRNQEALKAITRYKATDLRKMERSMVSNEKQMARLKARIDKAQAPKVKDDKLSPARIKAIQERERERLKTLEAKAKEKEKLRKERERERERARLAKERERKRLLVAKERERERARLAKERERERARIQKVKELEREKIRKEKEAVKAKLAKEKEKLQEMMKGLSKEEQEKLKAKLEAQKQRRLAKLDALVKVKESDAIPVEDEKYMAEQIVKDQELLEEQSQIDAKFLAEQRAKDEEVLAEQRTKDKLLKKDS